MIDEDNKKDIENIRYYKSSIENKNTAWRVFVTSSYQKNFSLILLKCEKLNGKSPMIKIKVNKSDNLTYIPYDMEHKWPRHQ